MTRILISFVLLTAVRGVITAESRSSGSAAELRVRAPAQAESDAAVEMGERNRAPRGVLSGVREGGHSEGRAKLPKIVVVVSKRNPIVSLKAAELRRVFLRQQTQWPNRWTITVYERSVESQIRQRFSKHVLKKRPRELKEYWMNLQLTRGLKPPKVLRSARLVKEYLRRVKGGVGYLYEWEVDDTVKVIEIRDADHAE
jgi:hypothetical protein